MACHHRVALLLADMIRDTSHGNRWHRLAAATEGLSDGDLAYQPVPALACDWDEERPYPCIATPRRILQHAAYWTAQHGDEAGPRTDDESEEAWDSATLTADPDDAQSLVAALDAACRRLHARVVRLEDTALGALLPGHPRDVCRGLALMDGGITHLAWHGGQVALLVQWRHAQEAESMTRPGGESGLLEYPGERDWTDFGVTCRRDLCLRLLRSAYAESPMQSLRRMVGGATPAEMDWSPFPDHCSPMCALAEHVAHCKVVYADHAFGDRRLEWSDCSSVLGIANGCRDPEEWLAALDRAHGYLCDRVAHASDEDLDRVNPMHHGVPHTGWQVVASMAQHDAWHGGQLAVIRAAYAGLARE